MTLVFEMSSALLLAFAINGVLFFNVFFGGALISLGSAGLIAWSGKRVLDRRRIIRAQLESPGDVAPGALTQSQLPSAAHQGGLSSSERTGALSIKDSTHTLPLATQDLNDDPTSSLD